MRYAALSVCAILVVAAASSAGATTYISKSGKELYDITAGTTSFSASLPKLNSATDILTSAALEYHFETIGTVNETVVTANPKPNSLGQSGVGFNLDFNLITADCNATYSCNIGVFTPSVHATRTGYTPVITTYDYSNKGSLTITAAQLVGDPANSLDFQVDLSSSNDAYDLLTYAGIALTSTYKFAASSFIGLNYTYLEAVPDPITPPSSPAPAAVPEPAAWAMMITGFGLIGSTLRRKRVRAGGFEEGIGA